MQPYRKIRQESHRRRRRRKTAESHWGNLQSRISGRWGRLGVLFGFLLAAIIVAVVWLRAHDRRDDVDSAKVADELEESMETAEAVAREFLKESDPEKRLQWVRNADEVKARLAEYPEEARSEVGEIEKVLGHQMDGGRSVTGFVVAFSSGNLRLMEVVGTPEGPRVDWDAYARHGTASWEDLWSGKAKQALVRVFCEPSTERPEPFEDQGKWTCFRMSGPELPQAALGFAQVGHVREKMMKQVVLGTPNYRQRFTLEIVRHEGKHEPLFEITRCLAVGWVVDDTPVEDVWSNRTE